MNTYFYHTVSTPPGDFLLAVDEAGAIVATAFGDQAALRSRLHPRHLLSDKSVRSRVESDGCPLISDSRRTAEAVAQVRAYFAGELRVFTLPLAPAGSAFQHRVWAALRAIPFGETRSYGDLARALQSSPRAIGRANATNPICVIVPCHRVIGADGSLTGFAFGETIKRRLLDHERTAVSFDAPRAQLAAAS